MPTLPAMSLVLVPADDVPVEVPKDLEFPVLVPADDVPVEVPNDLEFPVLVPVEDVKNPADVPTDVPVDVLADGPQFSTLWKTPTDGPGNLPIELNLLLPVFAGKIGA